MLDDIRTADVPETEETTTMTTDETIRDLDTLLAILRSMPADESEAIAYATAHGLPVVGGRVAYDELPSFGGETPASTFGVWSWDADRLLVGEGSDWRIVSRSER